jgi:hypothetical protein
VTGGDVMSALPLLPMFAILGVSVPLSSVARRYEGCVIMPMSTPKKYPYGLTSIVIRPLCVLANSYT